MSGRTVRVEVLAYCEGSAYPAHRTVAICDALGLDPATPFDPATQRCVVVDVCTTCGGRGKVHNDYKRQPHTNSADMTCPGCGGRGVRWTT